MTNPTEHDVRPSIGQGVLHLFFKTSAATDRRSAISAVDHARTREDQVIAIGMLGHKADVAIMAVGPNLWSLRQLQTDLVTSGLELVDSYFSLTELSEYAMGIPDEAKNARLYPQLPPEDKPAWCFYPMSKRRDPGQNWFTTDFDERKALMYEHGTSGRKFAGRIVQLITGSTGLDDFEWGVTLFGQYPDDLKEVVYTMRFDQASAVFAEFGTFYTGMVADLSELV